MTEAFQQPANPFFSGALCTWVSGEPLGTTTHHLAETPALLLPGHESSSFICLHLGPKVPLLNIMPQHGSGIPICSWLKALETGTQFKELLVHG